MMQEHPNVAYIDLRSDTVTRPTPEMRRAMADAIVGDDQYGEDPTVDRLERLAASKLGMEAAVFVPSGTMGNVSALMAWCGRGDEMILGDQSHIYWFESGGPAALGGITQFVVPTETDGSLALDRVGAAIRPRRAGYPRTSAVAIENSHNRRSGRALPMAYLSELRSMTQRLGVPVHMDGARIFNAAAALGLPAAEIAQQVDSIQFCLSKGLAAPVGSIVAGTSGFITEVRRQRKLLGGAMRQAGVIAAAGIIALEQMIDRLPEDHGRAKTLAQGLAGVPGLGIDPDIVETNILVVRIDSRLDQAEVVERLKENGLLVSNYGAVGVRMVTHNDVDDADIERVLDIVTETLPWMLEGRATRAAD
jgi:threonine aldolase